MEAARKSKSHFEWISEHKFRCLNDIGFEFTDLAFDSILDKAGKHAQTFLQGKGNVVFNEEVIPTVIPKRTCSSRE